MTSIQNIIILFISSENTKYHLVILSMENIQSQNNLHNAVFNDWVNIIYLIISIIKYLVILWPNNKLKPPFGELRTIHIFFHQNLFIWTQIFLTALSYSLLDANNRITAEQHFFGSDDCIKRNIEKWKSPSRNLLWIYYSFSLEINPPIFMGSFCCCN